MKRDVLRSLAERAGVEPGYAAAGSGAWRRSSDRTRARLLAALELGPGDAAWLAERERARRAARPRPAPRCVAARDRLGGRDGFGIWANLYSLRGRGGLGIGNLSDLAELVALAGAAGAAFVGTSPLHALRNRPPDTSPYQPTSRLFGNPLYLDATRVPEWKRAPEARALLESGAGAEERRRLERAPRIDYARAAALHDRVCRALHARFRDERARRPGARSRDYARFCRERGERLRDFATFCAIEASRAAAGRPRDWRRWPAGLRAPGLPAVARFREQHEREVDYFRFLHFELDRQLGSVARAAQRAGLALGLYPDLAVGSAASGFDTWAFGDHFVGSVALGAPPDDYSADGQDWGLPPLHPWKLDRDDYALFRALLRANFAHAGMLRIDHVLGLARQYWIPAGEPGSRGGYVRFPLAELLAVLAEESQRAGAVVVGEDLGTVPRGLPARLAQHGVLSCRVLLFERDAAGRFRAARRYSRRALVSADTHDHPTLPAFLAGRDIELRHSLGLIPGGSALARARAERGATLDALLRRLRADGALPAGPAPGAPELCAAVHRFLCATPAPLVAISLDDLAGEVEPVNLPGVPPAVYPSWTRRMARGVGALARDPDVALALAGAEGRSLRRASRR